MALHNVLLRNKSYLVLKSMTVLMPRSSLMSCLSVRVASSRVVLVVFTCVCVLCDVLTWSCRAVEQTFTYASIKGKSF